MRPIRLAFNILRYLGPRIVLLRAGIYARKYTGMTRRLFRSRDWDGIHLEEIFSPGVPTGTVDYANYKRENAPPFLFPLGNPPHVPDSIRRAKTTRQPSFQERIELLKQDRCVYFFHIPSPQSIDWYANPFDAKQSDPQRHFCEIPDYLPQQGDPRMLWEPSRAAWAIDCAKAAAYGSSVEIEETFWRWVDSWMDRCPPYQGFQWKCGQESAVRVIAILIGFWALANDRQTAPDRFLQMARLAWVTAYRIIHYINYAISQKNNHATTEACGLLLIAQLFPEFRDSPSWEARARRVIEKEVQRQTYDDGSYVQHSMNYQRVMMQGAILALRMAELSGRPFDRKIYQTIDHCGEFLYQMMDPDTGQTPLYGNNDGAYVLPFSECSFLDFRPVVQMAHYATHRSRTLPPGPWDEDWIWLFGGADVNVERVQPPQPVSRSFEAGGYYTLRQKNSWCMLRSHTYQDRPGHCDQLHVDLWWRSQNILRDCGTYQYYIPGRPDVEYYFKSVRAHNVVEVDDENPLELASRFLWFPWPRGIVRERSTNSNGPLYLEAEQYDYDRHPWRTLHRRAVVSLPSDVWVIVDDLLSDGQHAMMLRWHLIDVPYSLDDEKGTLLLDTVEGEFGISVSGNPGVPTSCAVVRGRDEKNNVQGFAAPYYGQRLPIPTLEVRWSTSGAQRIVTVLSPSQAIIPRKLAGDAEVELWMIETPDNSHHLELAKPRRTAERVFLGQKTAGRDVEVS